MSDLTNLTILQIKEGLKNKKFSVLEVTNAFISASEKIKDLNVYNTFTPEKALESSKIDLRQISPRRLLAPITLVGRTALSLETKTKFEIWFSIAIFPVIQAPMILFLTPSQIFSSTNGTCL